MHPERRPPTDGIALSIGLCASTNAAAAIRLAESRVVAFEARRRRARGDCFYLSRARRFRKVGREN